MFRSFVSSEAWDFAVMPHSSPIVHPGNLPGLNGNVFERAGDGKFCTVSGRKRRVARSVEHNRVQARLLRGTNFCTQTRFVSFRCLVDEYHVESFAL